MPPKNSLPRLVSAGAAFSNASARAATISARGSHEPVSSICTGAKRRLTGCRYERRARALQERIARHTRGPTRYRVGLLRNRGRRIDLLGLVCARRPAVLLACRSDYVCRAGILAAAHFESAMGATL